MCSMHTTKCNACLSKLKSGILFECADCRMHLCQGCVERRIEEMGRDPLARGFDVHSPNHEGFVDAFLEWRDGDGKGEGKGKEGFVAGNGVVFEVKTYSKAKAKAKDFDAAEMVKEEKGKGKGRDKKVPPKLDLRPSSDPTEPTEPRRRCLRVNHRGQVQSRAAQRPLTPYPYRPEESWPNDLGLLDEVDERVPGVRGETNAAGGTDGGGGDDDAVTRTGATGAGAGRSPRPRRRIRSTYSSGSDSDSDSDSAWIIQRTRSPAGDAAPGLGSSVLSEEANVGPSSVATADAEAAAVLVGMNREGEWEREYVWY